MNRMLRVIVPSAVLLCVLTWASIATAAPTAWQRIDITLLSEQTDGVLLVSGELPETVTLPAEAELSVPAGSSLQWVGEILGGESDDDPELTYTKSTVGSSDVYRFTLTKSRIAQLEILTTAATFDGSSYASALKWPATQAVPLVTLNVQLPEDARIVEPPAGATLQPGTSGYSFYTKSVQDVKPGDELGLTFTYQVAAAPVADAGGRSSSSTVALIVLGIAAAGAVLVLLLVLLRRRAPSAIEELAEESDEPAAERAPAPTTPVATGKRNLLTTAIVVAFVVIAVVVGTQTIKPQAQGDSFTQTFSAGEPCSTATIALSVPRGANPAKTAETLFTALRTVGGMNTATFNFKTATLEAGFCESKTTEAAVREALAPTGLLSTTE